MYKKVREGLSEQEKEKLKKSEILWIAKRDRKAEKDSKDWIGGTGYPLIYNGSKIRTTKARIKWLIRYYAK